MATDISKLGGLIKVTQAGVNAKSYTTESIPPYQFTSNGELIFAGYLIPLADLRIAGSGTAPANVADAQTALDALFPNAGGSASTTYLVYTAILTQSGTNAPVATVLENTLGSITPSYDGVGGFSLNAGVGVFTTGKTFVSSIGVKYLSIPTLDNIYVETIFDQGNDYITLFTYEAAAQVNGILIDYPIEIRVYP